MTKGRFTLVNESLSFPHLVDARIIDFWAQDEQKVAKLLGNRSNIDEVTAKFRYILDIDGNCAAFRLQSLLGKNVVILKPTSNERQWFSSALLPWVHYIPVDLRPLQIHEDELTRAHRFDRTVRQRSNLEEVMKWAIANTNHSIHIMKNANLFSNDYLSPGAVDCYIVCLVTEISKLFDFNVSEKIDSFLLSNSITSTTKHRPKSHKLSKSHP